MKLQEDGRKFKEMRKLMILSGWFLCAAAFLAGGLGVLGVSGKYNLQRQTISYVMEEENAAQDVLVMSVEKTIRQERGNRYEEGGYSYNEDILTFLLMGINQEERVDRLFLLVLNPQEEAMKLIPVSCNTMTTIDIYDEQGGYKGAITEQIGIQYGFGRNEKEGCEYQVKAVRNLFYGIPISGYLAVDIDDIPKVMELIDELNLENIRSIAGSVEPSAAGRLERESRLLAELISQGKQMVRKDFTIPLKIYHKLSGSAVTNITADEAAYLAATAGGYHFDAGQIITIPGKYINDEFYADEDGIYNLIIDIFYEFTGDRQDGG